MRSAEETALLISHTNEASAQKLSSTVATVYSPVEGASYAHHPHIAVFKGKFYAIFSCGQKNEEDIGQSMMLSVSNDGTVWSDAIVLAEGDKSSYTVVIPGGLYSTDDRLIAYYSTYQYDESCIETNNDGYVRPLSENTIRTNWEMHSYATTDGVNWTYCDIDVVAGNFAPKQTASGRLIRCGAGINAYTDDITGLNGWQKISTDPTEAYAEGVQIITESDFYATDDGVLHMLFRTNGEVLYCSESYDDGLTWTRPYRTSFTSDSSKFTVGRLPNGIYYWIGNTETLRNPLYVYLSKDGLSFEEHYIIRDEAYTQQFEGMYKSGLYGYPSVEIYGEYMYIIYSKNKETIEISKIALSDLDY